MSNKKITDLPPTATVDFADVLEIVQGGISKSIAVGILAPATKIGPGATPTALVGLVAIPGSSLFPIRSDGAPALSQAIAPTWSALHTFSLTPVVPNSSWTYAKIQNVSATSRILGRVTAGAGVIEELTGTQATTLLDVFTSGLKGLVPLSGGGTTTFLRADGTFANNGANPTASLGLAAINGSASTFMRSDGAPALDVTIAPTWSATHTFSLTPVVPNSSWTYAKIQNVSATSRILGRITAGAGVIEELTGANLATIIGTSLGANPSASVGLTTVNGSAGTYMRSDAAPQLDVSIAPTWTGTHTFNASNAQVVLQNASAAANIKNWISRVSTAGTWAISTASDAAPATTVTDALAFTRTTTAVTAMSFGNTTDNPTFAFLGTGAGTVGGAWKFSQTTGASGSYVTQLQNLTATGYTSFRILNDQNTASRALSLDYSGSTFAGALSAGGPTGESAAITVVGNFPLSIATSNTERIRVTGVGAVHFVSVGTTASAANAFLDNAASPVNQLLRSTSSIRYKSDVENLTAYAVESSKLLRPVTYRSKAPADDKTKRWYGLIAEEVAAVDPMLVHWTLIDNTPMPDGVMYDRIVVLLLKRLQNLEAQVVALEEAERVRSLRLA